jgi:hypothetical protein
VAPTILASRARVDHAPQVERILGALRIDVLKIVAFETLILESELKQCRSIMSIKMRPNEQTEWRAKNPDSLRFGRAAAR